MVEDAGCEQGVANMLEKSREKRASKPKPYKLTCSRVSFVPAFVSRGILALWTPLFGFKVWVHKVRRIEVRT